MRILFYGAVLALSVFYAAVAHAREALILVGAEVTDSAIAQKYEIRTAHARSYLKLREMAQAYRARIVDADQAQWKAGADLLEKAAETYLEIARLLKKGEVLHEERASYQQNGVKTPQYINELIEHWHILARKASEEGDARVIELIGWGLDFVMKEPVCQDGSKERHGMFCVSVAVNTLQPSMLFLQELTPLRISLILLAVRFEQLNQ